MDDVGAEAEPIHDAGPIVLDEHVGVFDQVEEYGRPCCAAEVDAQVAFACVLLDEVARQAVAARGGKPSEVTGWRFDLDDVGTEVAQHARAVRTGQHACQVEHPDAGQW